MLVSERRGARSLSRRVGRSREGGLGVVFRKAGTRQEQHSRHYRLGFAANSGRQPCGKKPDGPTEGRILGALGRCARPGRTLRAWRLITGLALEIRRKPPVCRAGCFAAAAVMA